MAKLYPPYIENKIPAFVGTTIVVPFIMNRAVSIGDIRSGGGLYLIVKRLNRDEILVTKESSGEYLYDNCYATFVLTATEQAQFNIGQYYRVQLAYIAPDGTVGYYSSVGVIKYTAYPEVLIDNLKEVESNSHLYEYTGVYRQLAGTGDETEKLYSSHMTLSDSYGNVIYSSGEVIHNTTGDSVPNEAHESFKIPRGLSDDELYTLQYTVTTINGLTVTSPPYRIITGIDSSLAKTDLENVRLLATPNPSKGTIELSLYSSLPGDNAITGMFVVSRTEATSMQMWQSIRYLIFSHVSLADIHITDYAVEQGVQYVYSIQQYNNYGIYSGRRLSAITSVDFEDYFLLDNQHQLKIKFNPKISSLKPVMSTQRVNTIGSKYPHIVRAGSVNYKEFQLGGLLSYHMDDEETFVDWTSLGLDTVVASKKNSTYKQAVEHIKRMPSYDLNEANVTAERLFKLQVLDWLNNGEWKILKSPTEGNYVVILLDASLSPEDKVGRMLHNFSCTAVEITEFSYETLVTMGFFQDSVLTVAQWKSILLTEINKSTGQLTFKTGEILPSGTSATEIDIKEMQPGTVITINSQQFTIGATGSYYARVDVPITSIRIPSGYTGGGLITYRAPSVVQTRFDLVAGYQTQYIVGQQFIGTGINTNILSETISSNTPSYYFNMRDHLGKFIGLRFQKRNVANIYCQYSATSNGVPTTSTPYYWINSLDSRYSVTKTGYNSFTWNQATSLYKIYYTDRTPAYSGYYYDPNTNRVHQDNLNLYTVRVDYTNSQNRLQTDNINLQDAQIPITVWDKEFQPEAIYAAPGVIVELTYIRQSTKYVYETINNVVMTAYNNYASKLALFQHAITTPDAVTGVRACAYSGSNPTTEGKRDWLNQREAEINTLRNNVKSLYQTFIQRLQNAYNTDLTYQHL